jgi:hypothetical protein
MSPAEQAAYQRATTSGGAYQQDLSRARTFADQAAQPFTSFDVSEYMNPYIKGALDPAAREIREEMAREQNRLGSRAGEVGAFGGSRQAIAEAENVRGGKEAIGDLYGRGYASAFESARDQINKDRAASRAAGEQFRAIGGQAQTQLTQEIGNLLSVGGLERNLRQAGLDFDYQQFTEARDWDITNLQPLLAALSSVPYSETQTGTTTNTQKKSALSTIAGIGMTAFGAFTMNPAMIGAGLGSLSGGGAPEGMPTSMPGIPGRQQQPVGGTFPGATPPYVPEYSNQSGSFPAMGWGPTGPTIAPDYSGGIF